MFISIDFNFIFAAVNLLILYLVLKKFVFKPVTQNIEKRTGEIQSNIDSALKDKEEAEKLRIQYENELAISKKKAQRIVDEARKRANKEYDAIIDEAKDRSHKIREKAKRDTEIERKESLKKMRADITGLALSAASRVIQENMDTEKNRRIIERFLDEEGVA